MLIKSLHLKNILSFKDTRLDLQPLNVLIGANGSGKSNLIDVIAMLQAVPVDLPAFFRRSGPTGDWKWKGGDSEAPDVRVSAIQADIHNPERPDMPLRYDLLIDASDNSLKVESEWLLDLSPDTGQSRPYFFRGASGDGRAMPSEEAVAIAELTGEGIRTQLSADTIDSAQSVFSAMRHPFIFPVLSQTADRLSAIKTYRSWNVGRNSAVRSPQPTDGVVSFPEEDFNNLALVVNDLRERQGLGPTMDKYLERFYETYQSLHTPIYGNTVSLTVREAGLSRPLPAPRLSDGTIRFIALLAILCHPEPPPLICIEEPEIAMHPDSLGLIAELMRKASERTQIIVTTHSPQFVDLFSDEPDTVIVCERDRHPADGTQFNRLSREKLGDWLVDYTLGDAWMRGALGGVR
ncbi:MAG: AAA family ATPase [Dehalococcoidia bacterium]|nr:AAA family ATPase [Dehalococcoidia bacterium]